MQQEKRNGMKEVRVVQLNTQTYGGAAIVARRLHQAFVQMANIDSTLLSNFGISNSGIKNQIILNRSPIKYLLRKQALKIAPVYNLIKLIESFTEHPNLKNRPSGHEVFSPRVNAGPRISIEELRHADVIHFHYINNFVNLKSFVEEHNSKKFVWTLHDMNPITGGCHHSDGCDGYQSTCRNCPQLKNTIDEDFAHKLLQQKLDALSPLKNEQLHIVSPSSWLLNQSKASTITKRFRHSLIPNPGILPDIYTNKEQLRISLKIPLNKKVILFVSDNLRNPRKGLHVLFKALQTFDRKEELHIIGIGNKGAQPSGIKINYTGVIHDKELLAKYYQAADLLILPSIAENSPLVVIEALCCGTPVIGTDVGGIPELINEHNGRLFPLGDFATLQRLIEECIQPNVFDRKNIGLNARVQFNPSRIATLYSEVYHALNQSKLDEAKR